MPKSPESTAIGPQEEKRPIAMRELSEFEDYRDILGEAYAVLKDKNPKISLSRLAKQVSLDRSFLSMVLKKKRHLDIRRLGKVAEAFQVPGNRMDYFYISFMNSQLGKVDQFNILSSFIRAYRYSVKRSVSFDSADDLQKSLMEQLDNGSNLSFFLMGLADFPDFSPEPQWVKARLSDKSVTDEEIRESLDYLIKKGFIQKDSQKGWRSSSVDFSGNPFETNFGVPSVIPYFEGLKSFIASPVGYKPFQVFAMAYSFDEAAIQELHQEMDALYAKARDLSAKVAKPTHVMSLGAWMYSVAREPEKK